MPILLLIIGLTAAEPTPERDGFAFFESKIRPVLVQHCYECHSDNAKKVQGDLRLDTRDAKDLVLLYGKDSLFPFAYTYRDYVIRAMNEDLPFDRFIEHQLAADFRDDGWSLKRLHARIVSSSTYRQASADRSECLAADPQNRRWWRAARRRLDFESMRDSLLAVSGRLDGQVGGRPVEIAAAPDVRRRTAYGLVDRQNLPGLFRAFDFASPDQSAARRPDTIVPQQALFAMNSPFVLLQARSLVERVQHDPGPHGADGHGRTRHTSPNDSCVNKDCSNNPCSNDNLVASVERLRRLYRIVLLREPDAEEIHAATDFLAGSPGDDGSQLTPWQQYAQVLLLSNEFLFLD